MKLLIISPSIPYPLSTGGNVAQFSMLNYLQNHIVIDYCCVVWNRGQLQSIDELKKELPKINFIVFNHISVATQKSIPSFVLLYRRLALFIKNKTSKTTTNNNKTIDEFKDNPSAQLQIKTEEYIDALQKLLSQDCWDIIQTEFFEMLDLVHLFPKKAKTVFVSHESKTLRMDSAKGYSNAKDSFINYLIQLNKHIEVSFLKEYDRVIVFSADDAKRLQDFGVGNVVVSPFTTLSGQLDPVVSDSYDKLIFLGGSNHYPNVDGLNWFVENIFPSIYEKYKIPLLIVGNWNKRLTSKYQEGAIQHLGFIQNLDSVFKNGILIVPVRIGNGIRTKILSGLKMKVPIISTSLGFEGLNLIDGENILVANTVEEFMDKIYFLKNSEIALVHKILAKGEQFFQEKYNLDVLGEVRLHIYKEMLVK